MSPISLRRWSAVHRWSSLVCTLFLLVICVTGLPLVFADDIDDWLHPPPLAAVVPSSDSVSLDRLVAESRARFPGERVVTVFRDDRAPLVNVWLAAKPDASTGRPARLHYLAFDARSGMALEDVQPAGQRRGRVMNVMLTLHRDMFAGLPGELFLGAMGVLFVVAVISGVVLYGPFTKHLEFGTIRATRARRIRWLDLHNLLGIATLVWVFVVGATGVINELAKPLFGLWLRGDVAQLLSRYHGQTPPAPSALTSVQAALVTATRAVPGMRVAEITFPSRGGSPWHYVAWTKGETPLTSRLSRPVLIDARTGELAAILDMPWYLRTLEVSRPLHFGDYGGLPLKVLWALLDVITIVVLGSGVYLWFSRGARAKGERMKVAARQTQVGEQV